MASVKKIIKSVLPTQVVNIIQEYRLKRSCQEYRSLSTQQVFTKIYEEDVWGKSEDLSQRFFSGTGSHESKIVKTYIEAIHKFLSSYEKKPSVVDLGCGDFFIGSTVRPLCETYIACDIVQPLIEFNKEKYKPLGVDFRVLDLTKDELPRADIVFVRQVLQHLSNKQIQSALPQIQSQYKYLVLTEHLPGTEKFTHNLDKPAGPGIRLTIQSGIVLTSPPFNLKVKEQKHLCQAYETGGVIRTTLYTLS